MAKMFFARCKTKASFVFHSLMNIFEISNTPNELRMAMQLQL